MVKLFNWKSLRMSKSHQLLISPNIVYSSSIHQRVTLNFHIHPRNHVAWDINLNFFSPLNTRHNVIKA